MSIQNVSIDSRINSAARFKNEMEANNRAGTPQAETSNRKQPIQEDSSQIADTLNNTMKEINERISFSVNEKTQSIVVKVINRETDEVVRQIPPKEAIRLLEHLQEYVGMLVDESR